MVVDKEAFAQGVTELFSQCGAITREKQFDVTQHTAQLVLFCTEVQEALELIVGASGNAELDYARDTINKSMLRFEGYRKHAKDFSDSSLLPIDGQLDAYVEELADLLIRLASYVDGNGLTDHFVKILADKMAYNSTRPVKHGKGF